MFYIGERANVRNIYWTGVIIQAEAEVIKIIPYSAVAGTPSKTVKFKNNDTVSD